MTTHTNCTHPATKAARAACRRAAGSTTIPRVAVAKAQAEAAPAARQIKSVVWERETCTRCGGTGRYPSACWNGVCLGCNGQGTKLTPNGKRAVTKYNAFLAANYTATVADLKPGDKIFKQGRWVTVHDIDLDYTKYSGNGYTTIGAGDNAYSFCSIYVAYTTKMNKHGEVINVLNQVGMFNSVIVKPASLQEAFRHVANMKGAHVEYAD